MAFAGLEISGVPCVGIEKERSVCAITWKRVSIVEVFNGKE
jgi:hypothetical protein